MNVLLKVVSASVLFAASATAQPVNGDDAQKVIDNYDFLISLYRDCSEGIAGKGDSCERLLDPREQVQEKLEEINKISLRKGWFKSQPEHIKKRIHESNRQLRDYLHRIMERKEENLRNFASLESGE